jgi:dTDP-4-amino-4,6-dideoxygalactose transaminase
MKSLPRLIQAISFFDGENGTLSILEEGNGIPFPTRRIYYIYGVESDCVRGRHGHKDLEQVLIVLSGSVDLFLEGANGTFQFHLNAPDVGVYIPSGHWRELRNFKPGTVVLVLASELYKESDYIRDHSEFIKWLEDQNSLKVIPYLDLTRYKSAPCDNVDLAVAGVVKSGHYINGPRMSQFESEFARFCGVQFSVGVGNGLEALVLILEALGIGRGAEVVVCASGFVATPLAVSRVGARPVFVDCGPGGNIDPERIGEVLTPACKAILLTHLYGVPADMDAINAIAERNGLAVIEDSCQAHGALYKGRPCGGLGTAAAFSFYPTKNLGAIGDGGCVVTDDQALAEKIRKLANYGSAKKYQHEMLGTNSRLDEMQAAILLVKLPQLADWNERRRHLAGIYFEQLDGLPGLVLPSAPEWTTPVWHVFPVRVQYGRRDALAEYLGEQGIGTNVHYPCALHQQMCYTPEFGQLSFPEAEALAAEELSLPLDAMHSSAEIRHVAKVVASFFQQGN